MEPFAVICNSDLFPGTCVCDPPFQSSGSFSALSKSHFWGVADPVFSFLYLWFPGPS